MKESGNLFFKENNWFEAKNKYEEAYEFADVPSDDECGKFKTVLESNKAAVYLKL